MGAVDLTLFQQWRVSTLRLETPGLGNYVVRECRDGTFEAEVLTAPGASWETIGEGYQTALAAVRACERDMNARMGGAL